ncbi:MAG TPA: hypothetical protein VK501_13015 [Baekduia sp.]|uniref:hypothetical protein n=1 Tax=Baekduia sp. TaxID=2600305 RepID=UPI002C7D4954|nr:hypothetical protein [Baekduia sp.]HMJ34827.1 hypothetical protein [Baekduia sp.]
MASRSCFGGLSLSFARIGALLTAAVMVATLASVCASTFSPSTAHASFFTFCSAASLGAYPNDRCAHSVSRQYAWTRSSVAVTSGVCAIVKTDAGGFGGNATAPACDYTDQWVYSYCGSPYSCNGYPTVTNNGQSSPYQFYAAANF